jgi:hypothetical protein
MHSHPPLRPEDELGIIWEALRDELTRMKQTPLPQEREKLQELRDRVSVFLVHLVKADRNLNNNSILDRRPTTGQGLPRPAQKQFRKLYRLLWSLPTGPHRGFFQRFKKQNQTLKRQTHQFESSLTNYLSHARQETPITTTTNQSRQNPPPLLPPPPRMTRSVATRFRF